MLNENTTLEPHVFVKKGWGYEQWICNNDKYCGKILIFEPNKKCSIHFHVVKDEVLFVDEGSIDLMYYWEGTEQRTTLQMKKGMAFRICPRLRHQMIAGSDGARIIEFSTHHEDSDSYRIEAGD